MLRAQFAQPFQKPGGWLHQVHVAHHRLDNNGGDFAANFFHGAFHASEVVVIQHQRLRGHLRRYARRRRIAEGQGAGTGLHQQEIGMAVIAAFELDDLAAAGVSPREANRAHGRLGAGRHQPHFFKTRQQAGQQLGHF